MPPSEPGERLVGLWQSLLRNRVSRWLSPGLVVVGMVWYFVGASTEAMGTAIVGFVAILVAATLVHILSQATGSASGKVAGIVVLWGAVVTGAVVVAVAMTSAILNRPLPVREKLASYLAPVAGVTRSSVNERTTEGDAASRPTVGAKSSTSTGPEGLPRAVSPNFEAGERPAIRPTLTSPDEHRTKVEEQERKRRGEE